MSEVIFHIRAPAAPNNRFEWHPGKKIVYRVIAAGDNEVGEPIAMDIEDQGSAINAALIWTRGYKAGSERTINGVII